MAGITEFCPKLSCLGIWFANESLLVDDLLLLTKASLCIDVSLGGIEL